MLIDKEKSDIYKSGNGIHESCVMVSERNFFQLNKS